MPPLRVSEEGHQLQFGDAGGNLDAPKIGFLHRLVGLLEEQGNLSLIAHHVVHVWGAHHAAQGALVVGGGLPVVGDVHARTCMCMCLLCVW